MQKIDWCEGVLQLTDIGTKNLSCQDCPDTGRSTGAYFIFYQGGPIYHCTHVPGPVALDCASGPGACVPWSIGPP